MDCLDSWLFQDYLFKIKPCEFDLSDYIYFSKYPKTMKEWSQILKSH